MSVGLDVFVINVAFAHQVLSSLFSVPLVAVGILFLTFQKSMTNNPARTKIVSFSGESLHLFLYIFSFGKMFLMRSACLISWAFANSFSIFGFFSKVSLLHSESVSSNLCMRFIKAPSSSV